MITTTDIYRSDPNKLSEIYQNLVVQKMKLDKFFSIFLDNTEFDEEDTTSDDWITYKEMLKEYERIDHLLTTTKYHLNRV